MAENNRGESGVRAIYLFRVGEQFPESLSFSENEPARKGSKHVVLVAGQGVSRLQSPNDFGDALAAVGQSYSEYRQIDVADC